jgi:hypothetical protein
MKERKKERKNKQVSNGTNRLKSIRESIFYIHRQILRGRMRGRESNREAEIGEQR